LAAARERSPGGVLVGGEAGVGKTRLLTEFSDQVRRQGTHVLVGGCVQLSGGGLPYGPIVEALRALGPTLDEAVQRKHLEPAQAELARLLSVGERDPLDHGASIGNAQSRLFELLLRLLAGLGETAPLVFIVEDVHWADRSTLDLLIFLFRNMREERILVVVSFRSEELHDRRETWTAVTEMARSRGVDRIELATFGLEELTSQLSGILTGPPSREVADRVFAWSGGNAFFAEELVAAGIGQESAQLPPTLRDVIMTRVEALSPDAQEILHIMAAANRQVPHDLIAAVAEASDRSLAAGLREAVAHRLLTVDPTTRSYSFRHTLAREAIYADLLPGDLTRLHTAIARGLAREETISGGSGQAATITAEIAHHWHAAQNFPMALAASVDAGRAAAKLYAFAEAHRQFDRALDLWHQVPDAEGKAGMTRDQLLELTSDVALWAGDVDRALTLVREALRDIDPVREPARAGVLQERLGRYLWRSGDSRGSLAAHTEANRLLANEAASPARARALGSQGAMLMIAGRYAEARLLCEEAIAVARTAGARRELGYSLNSLGVALTMLGEVEVGIARLHEARRIAEELDLYEDRHRAYANLAHVLMTAGRLEEAADVGMQGIQMARKLRLENTMGGAVFINTCELLLALGRWHELEDLLRQSPQLQASELFGPYLRVIRGGLYTATGRFDRAEAEFQAASPTRLKLEDPLFHGPYHAWLTELAIWQEDWPRAERSVRAGLERVVRGEDAHVVVQLCALGIRQAADSAEGARRTSVLTRPERVEPKGAEFLNRAREAAARYAVLPETRSGLMLCEAEYSRLTAVPAPAQWSATAASWDEIRQPYRATYARWRQAEVLLATGTGDEGVTVLLSAHASARQLGAEPLQHAIELLAHHWSIGLGEVDSLP
jgi:tetratricopeptide (TPR) repeat protein